MTIPEMPDIDADRTFSAGQDFQGPEAMFRLAKESSELVRDWLAEHGGLDRQILDRMRFEGLILPYLFEARRIGDQRGQFRERTPWAALYPGSE